MHTVDCCTAQVTICIVCHFNHHWTTSPAIKWKFAKLSRARKKQSNQYRQRLDLSFRPIKPRTRFHQSRFLGLSSFCNWRHSGSNRNGQSVWQPLTQEPTWWTQNISFLTARDPFSGPPISASESGEGNGAYVHLPKQSSIGQEQQMKRSEVIAPTSTQRGLVSCKRSTHIRILISYSLCFTGSKWSPTQRIIYFI